MHVEGSATGVATDDLKPAVNAALAPLVAEGIAPAALRRADRRAFIPRLHGALLKSEQDLNRFGRIGFTERARP
jgi:hypothetical protein